METKGNLGNEPAFPNEKYSIKVPTGKFSYGEQEFKTEVVFHRGMSKRFFAACYAMNGIMANNECGISYKPQIVAELAYSIADEMLKQENL